MERDKITRKWNGILKREGLGVIKPGNPSEKEGKDQKRSRNKWLPEWAKWDGKKHGKGSRK
jgi:hypothetical protein